MFDISLKRNKLKLNILFDLSFDTQNRITRMLKRGSVANDVELVSYFMKVMNIVSHSSIMRGIQVFLGTTFCLFKLNLLWFVRAYKTLFQKFHFKISRCSWDASRGRQRRGFGGLLLTKPEANLKNLQLTSNRKE